MDISFEDFCSDPQLLNEPISQPWIVFFKAVDGLPLTRTEKNIFRKFTGKDSYRARVYNEVTGICGRRSTKTTTMVKYGLYKSVCGGYDKLVKKGKRLRIPIIAQDLRIARDIKHDLGNMLTSSPVLSAMLDGDPMKDEVKLSNGIAFTVYPCTFRSTRGLSSPIVLLDEVAFWAVEGASEEEVVKAVKPAMAQFGDHRRLIKMTTPWQRAGMVFDEWEKRDRLTNKMIWQASTKVMNPLIPQKVLDEEKAEDLTYYMREYEALFVDDLESFFPPEDIKRAIMKGAQSISPIGELRGHYMASLDASQLTGKDRFTFAIGHDEMQDGTRRLIVDKLRGWKKAATIKVCDEIKRECDAYGVKVIHADQYAFTFLAELLKQRNLTLRQTAFTARSKPDIFLNMKSRLSHSTIRILDHPELLKEMRLIEAKKAASGTYKIAAPGKKHDDYVTVVALLAYKSKASGSRGTVILI